jgi:plastocyanin
MKITRTSLTVIAVTAALALPVVGRADHKDKAAQDVTVHFAMPQPQPPQAGVPGSPDNASTHFLMPDDVTIRKGGTVTFVVNGGGHGIAIHEVSKKTTRDDIAEDLCQGPAGTDEADRTARNAVCKATIQNMVTVAGNTILLNGTENLNYRITDGKGRLVIEPGFNINAANSGQAAVVANNPRVDDTENSDRLLATSGASPGDVNNPAAIATNKGGAFLTGTAFNPAATPPVNTPGNRIQVQFNRNGRFLVVCMNRAHLLNDHMFGFVNVGGDDDN